MAEHLKTQFLTTQWTQILGSGGSETDRPTEALVRLCESYRYPIYAFIRKRCGNVEEARDLTQGFFAFLIEKKIYRSATPERGRFRTFLLAAVKNYLSNTARDANREKRGGDKTHLQIDAEAAEAQFTSELTNVTPDTLFDREWANAVFDRVWELLQSEYEHLQQRDRFEALRSSWMASEDSLPYAELAEQLGISVAGVKSAVFRMRRRFRELFRATVAQLVENPNAVDEEIRYLTEVMAHSD
jgi:RNA polymerase sigma-70 factor (ECF subfamily)